MKQRSSWILATAFTVCACSERAPIVPSAAETDEQVSTAFDPATASELTDYSGSFKVIYQDGSGGAVNFAGDGTVTGKFGEQEVTAIYTVPAPGRICFDKVSTGDPPHCWRDEKTDGKGGWTGLMDDDTTVSVTPVH